MKHPRPQILFSGALTPTEQDHLANCVQCQERLQRFRHYVQLTEREELERECPSLLSHLPAAFSKGRLPKKEMEQVRKHLNDCELCHNRWVFAVKSLRNVPFRVILREEIRRYLNGRAEELGGKVPNWAETVLERVAWAFCSETESSEPILSKESVRRHVTEELEFLGHTDDSTFENACSLLVHDHGLIVPVSGDTGVHCCFIHHSFHEYLFARYLERSVAGRASLSSTDAWRSIEYNTFDSKWAEAIVFLAGILPSEKIRDQDVSSHQTARGEARPDGDHLGTAWLPLLDRQRAVALENETPRRRLIRSLFQGFGSNYELMARCLGEATGDVEDLTEDLIEQVQRLQSGSTELGYWGWMPLGLLAERYKSALKLLVDTLENAPEAGKRASAARAMKWAASTSEEAQRVLRDSLRNDPSGEVRAAAAGSLESGVFASQEVKDSLLDALKSDSDDSVGREAADVLKLFAPMCEEAQKSLIGVLQTGDKATVRRRAAQALSSSACVSTEVQMALLNALMEDPDDDAGEWAADSLSKGAVGSADIQHSLLSALMNVPEATIRRRIVCALRLPAEESPEVQEALARVLKDDPSKEVRVTTALVSNEAAASSDHLISALVDALEGDPEGEVRQCAGAALELAAKSSAAVVSALLEVLRRDTEFPVCHAAKHALWRAASDSEMSRRSLLTALAADHEYDVRAAAKAALEKDETPSAMIYSLLDVVMLGNPDEEVVATAKQMSRNSRAVLRIRVPESQPGTWL